MWDGYIINMKTIKLSNLVSPQSLSARSTMNIFDKTQSFLTSVFSNITQLSDGAIADIKSLFPRWVDFRGFCFANIDGLTREEIDSLTDQIYNDWR